MLVILIAVFFCFIFPFIMVVINVFKQKSDIMRDPLALIGGEQGLHAGELPERDGEDGILEGLLEFADHHRRVNGPDDHLFSMTAFVIVRNKWKACALLFAAMVASMVIPFQVLMVPLVSLYGGIFGVLNHRLTLILMHTGFSLSMATFMFHGSIHTNIPLELEEAAFIDGCTRWQTWWKIVFPLLKPTVATVAIIDAMAFWNDYLLPSLVLQKKDCIRSRSRRRSSTEPIRPTSVWSWQPCCWPCCLS